MKLGLIVIFFVAFIVSLLIFVKPYSRTITYKELHSTPSVLDSYKIFNLVNDYRASKKLNKLEWNQQMCVFAEKRLKEIYTNYSHERFWQNVNNAYKYMYAGENLSKGFFNEKTIFNQWINSPEHLANIVKPQYTDTCIASDSQYAVQEFASF